jgi:hypothetical protein
MNICKDRRFFWLSALFSVLCLGLFCPGYNCRSDRLYAPYPHHRLQVEALLEGQLSLSTSLERIAHGLTGYDGHIDQLWGLGVPLWMAPFEMVYRLFGLQMFPDRIALLAAVTLLAW